MAEEVKNYQVDRKYRITFEQAASTKGILGFKIEAHSDSIEEVTKDADSLLQWVKAIAASNEVK